MEDAEDIYDTTNFDNVLKRLRPSTEYYALPPRGPPQNLPHLSEADLDGLRTELLGENLASNLNMQGYAYESIKPNIEGDLMPKDIPLPDTNDLKHIDVCSIDGSNERVGRGIFYFLISRGAFVNFKYSTDGSKPYVYTKTRDFSAVIQVDGNIFNDSIIYDCQSPGANASGELDVLPIIQGTDKRPLRVGYDPTISNKSPSSQALGWAVKIQQALELECLSYVRSDVDAKTVCIRDGPLFSTSATKTDIKKGLGKTFDWGRNQILIASSKRVSESTLLVEALLGSQDLRDYWFEDQNLTDSTLKNLATDMLLLPKILHPGQRTPLMAAVPRARNQITKDEPRLMPLVCYYYSRMKPHTFIRLEVPKFMWDQNKDMVNEALKITAWQHELGHKAPLVQLFADKFSRLLSEKAILERKIDKKLDESGLVLPEAY